MRTMALLALVVASGASAQLINRINGRAGDANHVEDAAPLPNLDIALAGDSVNFQDGVQSFATLSRVTPDGKPIWVKGFDFPGEYDTGVGVRPVSGGDIAFIFYTGVGNNAVTIARTDALGALLWSRRYPGDYSYPPGGMKVEDGQEQSIVFANRYSTPEVSGGQLLRVSADTGAVELNNQYVGDPEYVFQVFFSDVVLGTEGEYFVTGGVYHFVPQLDQFKSDLLVARIDHTGAVLWSMVYDRVEGEFDVAEEGRGITITPRGNIAVIGRTSAPENSAAYDASLQLIIDRSTGNLIASDLMDAVDPAPASLETTSGGNLLASGTYRFGDGQGTAQMWLIDPLDAHSIWRAEYPDGTTFGNDAIEPPLPAPRSDANYVLVGANYASSVTPIGQPDQMFIRTDSGGNDHCAAKIWTPEPMQIEVRVSAIALTAISVQGTQDYTGQVFDYVLDTRVLCSQNPCPCDLNGDGFVDDADFVIFVVAYNILDCTDPSMPPGCPADFNGDGFVDDADFVIFVPAYNTLLCP